MQLQLWIAACIVLAISANASAQSTEFIANEGPAPDSVEELHGPIVIAFSDAEERPAAILGSLNEWLEEMSPFWSDMRVDANFRSYYFLRDNGTNVLIEENQAWAAGGTLKFESGKFWHTISTFGQAYVSGKFGEQIFTLGRRRINKPSLNGNDSRMLPQSFLGITLNGRWEFGARSRQ